MAWAHTWWQHEVVNGYKGPLLLSFLVFVATFVVTNTITRLIRAVRGPFHNINNGGVHLHHSTPGVLLLVVGGFAGVGAPPLSLWTYLAGVLVGAGASLALDEFAMIFRLQDVYWSQEGQLSVNVVTLAAACVGLAAVGVSPVNVDGLADGVVAVRGAAVVALLLHLLLVALAAFKGKYPTAFIGLFIAPAAWAAAVRLARPTSPWARWRYSPEKLEKARHRAARLRRQMGPCEAALGRHHRRDADCLEGQRAGNIMSLQNCHAASSPISLPINRMPALPRNLKRDLPEPENQSSSSKSRTKRPTVPMLQAWIVSDDCEVQCGAVFGAHLAWGVGKYAPEPKNYLSEQAKRPQIAVERF